MKVYLPNDSRISIGGAWTFKRNLEKGASKVDDFMVVNSPEKADVSLVAGATMILPNTFEQIKNLTKVVLRVDGVPELWRNHRHTWARFKEYFRRADGIVYQSKFIKRTTGKWLTRLCQIKSKAVVIMNGVDTTIFTPKGDKEAFWGSKIYLNINSRKDVNKRIEEVIQFFREEKLRNPYATLILAGKYPTYLIENNFGLYDYEKGKDFVYLGMLQAPEYVAKVMRTCDYFLFPSFADPCPNVLIEALHVMGLERMKLLNFEGGVWNIVYAFKSGYDFSLENMTRRYKDFFETL